MRMSPRLAEILGMAPGQPTQAIQSANIILRAGSDACADRKSRDFTPYPQDPQYKKAKLILAWINLANSRLPVQLNLTPQEKAELDARMGYPLGAVNANLWRVFNRADPKTRKLTKFGGRFYGSFQNLPREYRKRLIFASEPATELDFDALHPTMLYNKQGLPAPTGDLYKTGLSPADLEAISPGTIARLAKIRNIDSLREVAKTVFLVAINAKTAELAVKAANSTLREKFGVAFRHPPLYALLEALKAKHKSIAKFIASDAGIGLQYEDSCVAEAILRTMAGKGIPCLPVHDSFIVPASKEAVLWQAMIDAYQSRFKFPPRISKKY
jgi:hypothetical protein